MSWQDPKESRTCHATLTRCNAVTERCSPVTALVGALKDIGEANVTTGEEVIATAFGLAIMLSVYYGPAAE